MVAELRFEIELIDVAIRALERYARSIGADEDDPTAQTRNQSTPVPRIGRSSESKP
jgi:hypothetical protein